MSDHGAEPPAQPPSFWRQLVANPVTLGAIITAYVTLNTAIFNYLSSQHAQEVEKAKFRF